MVRITLLHAFAMYLSYVKTGFEVVLLVFVFLGSSENENRQESIASYYREVLHSPYARFPHQQARMRGHRHKSQQEAEKQDSGVRQGGIGNCFALIFQLEHTPSM